MSGYSNICNIERDLEIINAIAKEREIAIHNNIIQRHGTIETTNSLIKFTFVNERLMSVEATDITETLPSELHDNFGDTLDALEIEDGKNNLTIEFYGDSRHPNDIQSFYFTKNKL